MAQRSYNPNGQRMSTRLAQENAKQQEATRARAMLKRGIVTTKTPGGAAAQAGVRERSLTPGPSDALKNAQTNFDLNPQDPTKSMGEIEKNARERIAGSGMTGDAAEQQYQNSKDAAQVTMTNTGQGVRYDDKGGLVQGSGRLSLNNPSARFEEKKKAARDSELDSTKGYVKKTVSDDQGNTWETYVEDPGATAKAKDEAKNRFAQEDYAGAVMAENKQEAENANKQVANLEAFMASIPEEQQAMAQQLFQPLMDALGLQGNIAEQKLNMGMGAIDDAAAQTAEYVQGQMDDSDRYFDYFSRMNDRSLDRKLDSAETTRESERRVAQREADRSDQLFNRAIREQMITNEKNRKDQLLGLGISGGWRASRQTASVIDALSKGDRLVSNLVTDKLYADIESRDKLLAIEDRYHSNISAAYDSYDGSNATLFKEMMERGASIDKTIYESQKDKTKATNDLISAFLDSFGKNAKDFADTVVDQGKYAMDTYMKLDQQNFDRRRGAYGDAMKYIDTYGTQDKKQLQIFEQSLGLLPGSLSNNKTLEEIRLYKTTARGGSKVGIDFLASYIDQRMTYLGQIMPDTPVQDRAKMILNEVGNRYGKGSGGPETVGTAADYLNINYGQPSSYYDTVNVGRGIGILGNEQQNPGFYIVPEKSPVVEVNTFDGNL